MDDGFCNSMLGTTSIFPGTFQTACVARARRDGSTIYGVWDRCGPMVRIQIAPRAPRPLRLIGAAFCSRGSGGGSLSYRSAGSQVVCPSGSLGRTVSRSLFPRRTTFQSEGTVAESALQNAATSPALPNDGRLIYPRLPRRARDLGPVHYTSRGVVDGPRLYQLVRQRGRVRDLMFRSSFSAGSADVLVYVRIGRSPNASSHSMSAISATIPRPWM
jgi:hypothetical protein